MIRKENDSIILDGTVNCALNYNDPSLSDDDFIATLIYQLVNDDLGVRAGSTPRYEKAMLGHISKAVLQLVEEKGVKNRNGFITEAYNQCNNSIPQGFHFDFVPRAFLDGSDFAKRFATLEKN